MLTKSSANLQEGGAQSVPDTGSDALEVSGMTALDLSISTGAIVSSAAMACVYHATCAVRSQWLGSTAWQGRTDIAAVALTFDDGPELNTAYLLDVLATHRIRATFFVLGRQVERHPQLARRMLGGGHEIGNHSYSHPIYLCCSSRETEWQLTRTQDVISDATGVRPRLARPPRGVWQPCHSF
jgi:hypothetical protein